MAEFTCPKCEKVNEVDPPNGEAWWDSNTEEFDCEHCAAKLYVHVIVEITLAAELNTDEAVEMDAEDEVPRD